MIPPGGLTAETPRLIPFARGVYHVRNRSMLPGGGSPTQIGAESLACANPPACSTWTLSQSGLGSGAAVHGRFMQADPNATAIVMLCDLAQHGRTVKPYVDQFDMTARFQDGPNLYQYLRSKPWLLSDPLGLEGDSDSEEGGYTFDEFYQDFGAIMGFGSIPSPSDFILGGLRGLVEEYAVRLEWDVDWASDWSMSDDSHSRTDNTWVEFAALRGVYEAFEIAIPFTDRSINPLDGIFAAGSVSTASTVSNHHIMTNKNSKAGLRWTERYKVLFARHKISGDPFNWPENRVPMPDHVGPHSDAYHKRIYERVEASIRGKEGAEAEGAMRKKLGTIKNHMSKVGAKGYGLDKPGRRRR